MPTFCSLPVDRRQFFHAAAGSAAALVGAHLLGNAAPTGQRLKVAAVFTEFGYRKHAHVLLENFLEPYYFNGKAIDSGCDVVSFYRDQTPADDMTPEVAKAYKIGVYPTIAEALCLGGKSLAVDAVLSIGEHGNYPRNKKGQVEYPRKRFFDEIVQVFRKSGRVLPIFNDKHLSYRWDWAKEMADTAREMKIPFMAGSSVPLAQRVPALEIPAGAKIEEAISIHGGGLDSYDFHALEVLQSMVENRSGGETGVASVQYLGTDALTRAAKDGLWSPQLLQAIWDSQPNRSGPRSTLEQLFKTSPWGLLVRYRDGLRGLALKQVSGATNWGFACRLAGRKEPLATTLYVGPWQNRCLFKALAHAIQTHFRQGRPPYPLERTLLTTGMVAAGVESHFLKDVPYETPHLNLAYAARDFRSMREMGDTWKIITESLPDPHGIDHLGKLASTSVAAHTK